MATPKSHVKRVFKTAVNPDTLEEGIVTDLFVDVRRIDTLPIRFGSVVDGIEAQIIVYKFIWNDDPNNPIAGIDASKADMQFENANANRKTKKRRIHDPDVPTDKTSDLSINDNDILLWIVERLKINIPRGADFPVGQVVQIAFDNDLLDGSEGTPSQTRLTTFIKVVNNDLAGMKMADDDGKNPVMADWATYRKALQDGKTDKTDKFFLTVESTDKFTINFGADIKPPIAGLKGQGVVFVLTESPNNVEDLFDQVDQYGADLSKVIRLDPLQTIVNVGSNIIAVKFKAGDT